MSTEVELGTYTHRWSPLQVSLMESVAKHTKKRQYSFLVTQRPGNCHQSMNRLWRRFSAPYVVMMDEDVQILQDGWLDSLIEALDKTPDLGVVGCYELKTPAQLQAHEPREPKGFKLDYREWIPAYVMAFKLDRVKPFLHFDEAIPGQMGMTDLDACMQITHNHLRVAFNSEVIVYHPMRDDNETRTREERPFTSQQEAWYRDQCEYMGRKWGEAFWRILGRRA